MMEDWTERVKAAHEMVSALCSHPDSKESRKWIMSIPARPDYDPDLVITSGLMAAEKQIDAITAERDEWKRRLDAVVKDLEPKQGPPNPTNPTAVDVAIWRESRSIHRRIIAILNPEENEND